MFVCIFTPSSTPRYIHTPHSYTRVEAMNLIPGWHFPFYKAIGKIYFLLESPAVKNASVRRGRQVHPQAPVFFFQGFARVAQLVPGTRGLPRVEYL